MSVISASAIIDEAEWELALSLSRVEQIVEPGYQAMCGVEGGL